MTITTATWKTILGLIGIADGQEMAIKSGDRENNTVVLQFEVDDVKAFLFYLELHSATITGGPSFDEKDRLSFGSFIDPEGNPFWLWILTVYKLTYHSLYAGLRKLSV